jgi:hypothetical protein
MEQESSYSEMWWRGTGNSGLRSNVPNNSELTSSCDLGTEPDLRKIGKLGRDLEREIAPSLLWTRSFRKPPICENTVPTLLEILGREKISSMSDFIPKAGKVKIGGLGRKAQKLQSAREKAAQVKSGAKPLTGASLASFKAKDSFANTKKTTFQRKAV